MASSRQLPVSYDEKTFGAAGFSRDYTSLETWESATDTDRVTAESGAVLTCHDDSASYNMKVAIAGATTNSSYYVTIQQKKLDSVFS